MNREDILHMAREAGLQKTHPGMAPEVLAFAAMVEAKAASAERDACVRILLDGNYWNGAPYEVYKCAEDRASAIRARGQA